MGESAPPARRGSGLRRHGPAAILSLALHGLVVLVLFRLATDTPRPERASTTIRLVDDPRPAAAPSRTLAAAKASPTRQPSAPKRMAHLVTQPAVLAAAPVGTGDEEAAVGIEDADLAGAATAGSGGAGGGCDMPARLQTALRRDALVGASVAAARRGGAIGTRPILVWNGDWVKHGDQEGKGLAAVREALIWDIAFAPEACRKAPVRGLVVLALDDDPGGPRLVVGSKAWLWTDLLTPR